MSTSVAQRRPEKSEKSKVTKRQLKRVRSSVSQEHDVGSQPSSAATHSSLNDEQRGRAGGKGLKPISPALDGPTESDTSRPLDSEEIQALAIRLDELEKLHHKKVDEVHQQKSFIIKKTKTGPKKEQIQVAKIAADQPVYEQLASSGLRVDTLGNLLPYSILGSINEYAAELTESQATGLSSMSQMKQKPEDGIPETGTYNKGKKRATGSPDGGQRALHNWKYRMDERQQVMRNMSNALKRSPATLLMNQTDRWRERKELLDLMDATLPLLENGKNWRLHSEFWAQQQLVGNDDSGIHTTLTRTEAGLPRTFENIGKPSVGLIETGVDLTNKMSPNLHKRQWFDSDYLKQRLLQLNPYMKELVEHTPELPSLQIIGQNSLRPKTQQKSDIEIHVCGKTSDRDKEYEAEVTDNIQIEYDDKENEMIDSLDDLPDVIDPPIMGPALKIDTFIFQQMPHVDENEELDFIYEIRVQFDSQVNESVTRMVEIKNVGTTVFYYEWQQKPYTKPFDIVNSKTQRFYFDSRTSSILPNDTLKLSFVFKSNEPGIFTERWQLLTRPVLCGGRPIIFTLRGVTTEEDVHRQTRNEIEKMLRHKEAESIVQKIVVNMLDDIRTPERARSPIGFYNTEQEIFQEQNPELYFDYEIFEQMKKLHEQISTNNYEDKWDLSVESLRQKVLSLDEDHPNKQTLLEQINQAINQITLQPIAVSEQTTYLICFEIMNQFIDSFVDEMSSIHNKLQINEPSSESYPDIDLYGYGFDSWKKFYEFTKQQDTDKRQKSAGAGAATGAKDKKGATGKAERGKSPKKSPAPSQAPSATGKRGAASGNVSQMSTTKLPTFISPAKPDKERTPLTPEQIQQRSIITEASYLPVYTLLCRTFDRFEQALDELSENSAANNTNTLYANLASSIQKQSLDVLDILKDELTRNVTSIDVDSFF